MNNNIIYNIYMCVCVCVCVRVCMFLCLCVQFKYKCLMLQKNHFINSPKKNGSSKRYIRLINVNQLTKLKKLGKNYQKEC